MSDLDTGQISTCLSACIDVAALNPSPDEIETGLQPRLNHDAIANALFDGRRDNLADRVRIHRKTLAHQQQLTISARFEGQQIASKRARLADGVYRLTTFGLITHREGRDA